MSVTTGDYGKVGIDDPNKETISFAKDKVEEMYSTIITAIRLIDQNSSPAAMELVKALQLSAEEIATKGEISVTDISINRQ